MKTIIRKELRENFKLAALGIVIFTLLILQNYHDSSSALQDVSSQPYGYAQIAEKVQPLLASGFLTQTCFFCAIFGALLGWMQIFNERHRDLQAFLLHRPATRTEIFFAKTAAGLVLFLLATAVPLLCLVAWCRFPRNLALLFR